MFGLNCCCNNCLILSDDFSDAAVSLGPEAVFFPTPIPGSGNFHEYNGTAWSVSGGTIHTSTVGSPSGGSPGRYIYWDNSAYVVRQCWRMEADVSITGGYGVIGAFSFTPSKIYAGTPTSFYRECNWSGSGRIKIVRQNKISGGNPSLPTSLNYGEIAVPTTTLYLDGAVLTQIGDIGVPNFYLGGAGGTFSLDNFALYHEDRVIDPGGFGNPQLLLKTCPSSTSGDIAWPFGPTPDEVTVTVSGTTNIAVFPTPACSANYNGTYVCNLEAVAGTIFSPAHYAYRAYGSFAGGNTYLEVYPQFNPTNAAPYDVQVTVSFGGGSSIGGAATVSPVACGLSSVSGFANNSACQFAWTVSV